MGKASRWFKELFGFKKSESETKTSKKKWSFNKSHDGKDEIESDPNMHDLSLAVTEAAARAAAVVVQLTSNSGRTSLKVGSFCAVNPSPDVKRNYSRQGNRKERAAILIQSHFRAYLSRRALRALKALVKLQALARGHLVRKQTADVLRRMQALVRAQARARVVRALITESSFSSTKSSHFDYQGSKHGETTMFKVNSPFVMRRNGSKSREQGYRSRNDRTDEEIYDKILEVDPGKPYLDKSMEFEQEDDSGSAFCSAEKAFTPAKSDGSRSCQSVYSDNPNYMSNTESSKAKTRSHSAPKQRLQYDRSVSTKRYAMNGSIEPKLNNRRVSALHSKFMNKAYPGSGRLDRLGMPVIDTTGFSGGHWQRY